MDYTHLSWVGNYIAAKRPDVVVNIGDFADMPSLSSYAVGKAEAEGKRYKADIAAAQTGMRMLLEPVIAERRKSHGKWRPELHFTLGNHEDRITREVNANAKLIGSISVDDLRYRESGWQVHPFLVPVTIDGISYCHYFTSGVMGRPVGSAAALLRETHSSATMGHVQKFDYAVHAKTQRAGLFAGICYTHDEVYLGPQGNSTKRGIIVKHEVREGLYDLMTVSLDYLKRHYS